MTSHEKTLKSHSSKKEVESEEDVPKPDKTMHHAERFAFDRHITDTSTFEARRESKSVPPTIPVVPAASLDFTLHSDYSQCDLMEPIRPAVPQDQLGKDIEELLLKMINYKYYEPNYSKMYLTENAPYENRASCCIGEYEMYNMNLYLYEPFPKIHLEQCDSLNQCLDDDNSCGSKFRQAMKKCCIYCTRCIGMDW